MTSAGGSAHGFAADGSPLGTQQAGWTSAAGARARAAHAHRAATDLFARSIYHYARAHQGEPIKLLQAGCTGPADEVGLDQLRARGVVVGGRRVDAGHPVRR